jgi:hypothetical protein
MGDAGGSTFPFEITGPQIDARETVIVYARTTVDAVNLFSIETGGSIELFDVRLMSDNE